MPKTFLVLLCLCLTGCNGYPRLVSFPVEGSGRGINSPTSELNPHSNGRYIVFVSERNGSSDVYMFDTRIRRLVDLPGLNSLQDIASHPTISEDGRYIVFATSSSEGSDIYLYDRNTQQKRNLTENVTAQVRNPTISSDGGTIAYEVGKDGQWDIVVSDRTGRPLNP